MIELLFICVNIRKVQTYEAIEDAAKAPDVYLSSTSLVELNLWSHKAKCADLARFAIPILVEGTC